MKIVKAESRSRQVQCAGQSEGGGESQGRRWASGRGLSRGLRAWRWPLGFGLAFALPVYAISLTGPIRHAEGCSGGPSFFESWASLSPAVDAGIPVNGAFVVRGTTRASEASALDALSARVTDSAGAEVPGSLSLVYLEPMISPPILGWGGDYRGSIAWRPAAPFAPSSQYTLHLEVGRLSGGTTTTHSWSFQTAAAAAPAVAAPQGAEATFTFGTLLGGAEGHCLMLGASCAEARFPTQETPTQSLRVRFQPGLDPAMVPLVTYKVETYVAGGPGEVLATLRREPGDVNPLDALVHFAAPADQYCVRVRAVSALGGEAEVGPLCAAHDPGAGATSSLDRALVQCASPPNETELCLRYCQLHPTDDSCQGAAGAAGGPPNCFHGAPPPVPGPCGPGGAGGGGGGGTPVGGSAGAAGGTGGSLTSAPPGVGLLPPADDADGCSMPRGPSRSAVGAGISLALALVGLGRRSRRRRG
jgi:hypothetical protein